MFKYNTKETFFKNYGPYALVTGASEGIGKQFSISLAAMGITPILVARREKKLQELAKTLKQQFHLKAVVIKADLAKQAEVTKLFSQTKNYDIGLLVLNAGFGLAGNFESLYMKMQQQMLAVNCNAPLMLSHLFFTVLNKRKKAGIIFLASVVAHHCSPYLSVYSATKGFDRLLAHGLYQEWKPYGIDVLAVSPGPVATEFAQIAGMQEKMAASPAYIVRSALSALGKKAEVLPCFTAKFITYARNFLPTKFALSIGGYIMRSMRMN